MKKMKIPTRPAPSIEEALNINQSNQIQTHRKSKKPPPRPPPPKFNALNKRNRNFQDLPLIDLDSQLLDQFTPNNNRGFAGSESSSFNSSTNSLASSKTSFEYETVNLDPWEFQNIQSSSSTNISQSNFYVGDNNQIQTSQISIPTIIRPQNKQKSKNKYEPIEREQSPPMPSVPPPSPPKNATDIIVPYGIALYDFPGSQENDLSLQVNDIVFLLKQVNSEWLYGRVSDQEGMFPANYISIQVPLLEDNYVTAVYEFCPQIVGDLKLKPGQRIRVTGRLSPEWLIGESEGQSGQFPASFVDRIPSNI